MMVYVSLKFNATYPPNFIRIYVFRVVCCNKSCLQFVKLGYKLQEHKFYCSKNKQNFLFEFNKSFTVVLFLQLENSLFVFQRPQTNMIVKDLSFLSFEASISVMMVAINSNGHLFKLGPVCVIENRTGMLLCIIT